MSTKDSVAGQLADHLEPLWRFAYRLSQSQEAAKELTQGTCLRALECQSLYRGGSLKSWLFKIMHNLWRDEVRHNVRAGLKLVSSDATDDVLSADGPEQQMLLLDVQQMVNQLPEAQRTVLLLTAIEGFSYRETAALLEVPLGTVMSRLARAREKMGQSVQANEIDHVTHVVLGQAQEVPCKK